MQKLRLNVLRLQACCRNLDHMWKALSSGKIELNAEVSAGAWHCRVSLSGLVTPLYRYLY